MTKVFLPKEDQALPDYIGLKIHYVTGTMEEFKVASYQPVVNGVFEFWTEDDLCHWVMVENVKHFEWDKNFSKMVAIRNELKRKQDVSVQN